MTNLVPTPSLDDVFQLETTTPALGGPGGAANAPSQALLNRTAFLDLYTASPFRTSRIYGVNEPVLLTSGDVVKSTVPNNVTDPNVDMTGWIFYLSASFIKDSSGLSQQEVNNNLAQLVITPEYFGAEAGEADSSDALNQAVVFCAANNAVLDGRGKTYKANSIVLKDNTHIKNMRIVSNLFDAMNSSFTTDYGMLTPVKNVTLNNVHVDGMRQLHTAVATTMDGGRSGVLIRRPIDGLNIINCSLNNSVTDGLMLFPVDFSITSGDWFSFVKNVFIVNSEFNGNGRWGISADSVDDMLIIGSRAKFNGLDVDGGGAYTTGKSARLHLGLHYAGAIDVEEYHGFAYSKNITMSSCDFTENAGASVWMQRTGTLTSATFNITLNDVDMDFGTLNEAYPGKAMLIGGYSTVNTALSYRNILITNCGLGDGSIDMIGVDSSEISVLRSVTGVTLTESIVNSDKNYTFNPLDSYSNFYERSFSLKDKSAFWVGENNEETLLKIYNESTIGKSSTIEIVDGGSTKSGLKFTKQDDGYDLHFLNGSSSILTIRKYGSIVPDIDNIAQLGEAGLRFTNIFLTNAPTVGSDAKYKTDIAAMSAIEGEVAKDLRGLIKKYRLIASPEKTHVGVIAQEVVSAFKKHGLDAHEYSLIDFSNGVYSVRYEELILFILSAI